MYFILRDDSVNLKEYLNFSEGFLLRGEKTFASNGTRCAPWRNHFVKGHQFSLNLIKISKRIEAEQKKKKKEQK